MRHGETEWSRTGRHTGRTDLPLTELGRARARAMGNWLGGRPLVVFSSPLQRARETCALTGYVGTELDDLREWDYGEYEGLTTAEIRREAPTWTIWTGFVPGGETIVAVAERAARVISAALEAEGDVALFSHGHFLRVLAACWVQLPTEAGARLALDTASVSVLGFERDTRVISLWNVQPS